MSKFIFKLEPALKQRRMIEDGRQRDLAKLMRRQMILRNQIRDMQQTITESKNNLGKALVGRVNLDDVGGFARYSGQVTIRAQQIVIELSRLEGEIEQSRKLLIDATRDRKAIEKLRDRQYDRWKRARQKKMNTELDEIATQRYVRRLIGGLAS